MGNNWFLAMVFGVLLSAVCLAEPVQQELNQIDQSLRTIDRFSNRIPPRVRPLVVQRMEGQIRQMRRLIFKINRPGPVMRGWKQVQGSGADCNQVCRNLGLRSARSPEGAMCVSGENRAASAIGKINFTNGCWNGCTPHRVSPASSNGRYCYTPGQKRDNDRTDVTVGCFCSR